MVSMEEIRQFRQKYNHFMNLLGGEILELQEGYSLYRLPVQEQFYNPIGSVHGGVLFSLADAAAGNAAASYGMKMTTMDSSFHYLAPAMGSRELLCEARVIKHGKTVSVFSTEVRDEKGTNIAYGTFTYYNLGTPLLQEKDRVERRDGVNGAWTLPPEGMITDHGKGFPQKI